MKKYSSFNQLIVRYLFTILAVVLLGANVMADTVWNAGDATVDDLLTESNWSNGSPVTADNPGVVNNVAITVSSADSRPGTNGQNISMTFTDNSRVNFSGHFVPVGTMSSGSAGFTMRLEDSASVIVSGNNWVGNNVANSTVSPINGNEYVVSMYFTGSRNIPPSKNGGLPCRLKRT